MLTLTRKVSTEFAADNCLILDLPDGTRIRVWTVTDPKRRGGGGSIRTVIDAPKGVTISRGELLPPENSHPDYR